MTQYGYKPNRQTPQASAQEVGQELERIREEAGALTAKTVVEASRPKTALLHKELDLHIPIKERAERWSEHKARNVINVVTVIPECPDGQQAEPVQAFVNVTEGSVANPESRTYERTTDLLKDPIARARLVQRALDRLVTIQREFRVLRELANVWSAIDEAVTSIGK